MLLLFLADIVSTPSHCTGHYNIVISKGSTLEEFLALHLFQYLWIETKLKWNIMFWYEIIYQIQGEVTNHFVGTIDFGQWVYSEERKSGATKVIFHELISEGMNMKNWDKEFMCKNIPNFNIYMHTGR